MRLHYEPNVVKGAWNIFGKSYEYRQKYNEYKAQRYAELKAENAIDDEQLTIDGQ